MYFLPWGHLLSPVMLSSPTTFDFRKCVGDHWIQRNTNITTATHTTFDHKSTLAEVKRFRKDTDILLYGWYVSSFPAERAASRGSTPYNGNEWLIRGGSARKGYLFQPSAGI